MHVPRRCFKLPVRLDDAHVIAPSAWSTNDAASEAVPSRVWFDNSCNV
jgi:hypothetical protein